VAREIMGADIDLLRYISTITPEGADGDCIYCTLLPALLSG
jgi:hypothetical protein